MQQFATSAPVSLVLDIAAGQVRLIAADRTDTTVEVRPENAGKSKDVKAAEQTEVTYADGIVRITTPEAGNQMLGAAGAIEVTVQLPAGSRVDAKAAAAEYHGVGRLGDVTLEGGHRAVKLDETASARLTALDADVTIGRLTGAAEISTQRGSIRITEAVGGDVALTTQQGDITVATAPGTSATLDARTEYGRVHNALANTAGADAALNIRATTSYGDITARTA
ncbi:DUF4097 family beta strand repeat-containing protein [Streptomyces sp. NPDC048604]|uniref:DUF4097 family beta strand repeat-containing protein n=1 Tax=Streptomyces sp. NPDC048604 TaxID=3365578 RepID=UPI0037153AB4